MTSPPPAPQPVDVDLVGGVARRAAEPHRDTGGDARQRQGPGDVGVVAHPGDGEPVDPSELGRIVSRSAMAWRGGCRRRAGSRPARHRRRHALERGVLEDPRADGRVVAGEGAGHVLDRLPQAEADLIGPHGHRVPAQLHDRHLGGVPGAERRLLEQQGDTPSGQHLRGGGGQPPGRAPRQLGGAEVVDLEEVADHGRHPTSAGRRRGSPSPRRSRRR